jgi:sugar lactone lactonase YvrE
VSGLRIELGEGPVWDAAHERLLFVDIMRGDVHAFEPRTGVDRVFHVGTTVGAIAPTDNGDWILAAGLGFSRLDLESGVVTPMVDVAPEGRNLRMNDGCVDHAGRFWAGTMSMAGEAGVGSLYRLDPDGAAHTMLGGVTTSNGIDWSPDGRLMYYADSRTRRVDVFDCDVGTGAIGHRRPFITAPGADGVPDGLVVDSEGAVWVAFWNGSALCRYAPDGRPLETIDFPVSLVTKCAFGGADLRDVFVTSAWIDLSADERRAQPQAGGLFHVRADVPGQRPRRFAG